VTARRTPAKAQATARRMRSARLVIVTGISGSGKSQAIRALEDLGYFCVDNLPVKLLPTLADLTRRPNSGITRAAVVIDIREGAQLADFPGVYARVRRVADLHPLLIFLEATEEALVRRYSETRRPHPLAPTRSPLEGLREERKRLGPIRKLADVSLDTTDMTVHELRQAFMNLSRGTTAQRAPVVTLLSFGFKHGLPPDADLVFDVRFLPNPHFVPELRPRTGRDTRIARFLAQYPETAEFLERTTGLLRFLLPHYTDEGKSYVTVAVGCTGGRHRSVYVAETLKRRLADVPGVRLRVRHRDLGVV
jgi:UPF0042 nucleotide-binding protein